MNEETVIFRGSPSVLTRFGSMFLAVLVLAGGILGVLMLNQPLLWIVPGLAVLYILLTFIVVKAHRYEATTERVRHRKGIATRKTDEIELYRVTDMTLIEPLALRIFGLGTIEFRSADSSHPVFHLEAVRGARELREQLRRHIEECRDRKRVRLTEFEQ